MLSVAIIADEIFDSIDFYRILFPDYDSGDSVLVVFDRLGDKVLIFFTVYDSGRQETCGAAKFYYTKDRLCVDTFAKNIGDDILLI